MASSNCHLIPSIRSSKDGSKLGKVNLIDAHGDPVRDTKGRPVQLNRDQLRRGLGPDGRPLDLDTQIMIGKRGERRTLTLAEAADEFFGATPAQLYRSQLLPAASAEYYAGTTAKHFPGGDPTRLAGSVFLNAKSIDAVLALADPEHLAHGDDREAIKAMLRDAGVSAEAIEATFRDDCRYLTVATPGVDGAIPLSMLPPGTDVVWRETKSGAPGSLVVDTHDDRYLHPTGVATIVIGPGQGFEGEQVWTVHPGLPIPSGTDISEALAVRGYALGDVIPTEVLAELGVSFVQSGSSGVNLPRPPDAISLDERVEQAARYQDSVAAARGAYEALGPQRPEMTPGPQAAFAPLRSVAADEKSPNATGARVAWMTYGDPADVRIAMGEDGRNIYVLDGHAFRSSGYGLEAWMPAVDPGPYEPGRAFEAGWVKVDTLADLALFDDVDARAEMRFTEDRHRRYGWDDSVGVTVSEPRYVFTKPA